MNRENIFILLCEKQCPGFLHVKGSQVSIGPDGRTSLACGMCKAPMVVYQATGAERQALGILEAVEAWCLADDDNTVTLSRCRRGARWRVSFGGSEKQTQYVRGSSLADALAQAATVMRAECFEPTPSAGARDLRDDI
jgi:hypothetical protein